MNYLIFPFPRFNYIIHKMKYYAIHLTVMIMYKVPLFSQKLSFIIVSGVIQYDIRIFGLVFLHCFA